MIINVVLTVFLVLERVIRRVHPHCTFRHNRNTNTDSWSFGAGQTPMNTPTNSTVSQEDIHLTKV